MKVLMAIMLIALLVGCSDAKPDYNTYQSQPTQQGQESVGGGCGLEGINNENVKILPDMRNNL